MITRGCKELSCRDPPADPKARLVFFADLCELHVVSAIRRQHRIPLPKVRSSVEYLHEKLKTPRPLLDRDLMALTA